MQIPSAIIFMNNEMSDAERASISSQLQVNEIISFDEFNVRVDTDPNYPAIVRLRNLRILVILDSFQDQTNRNLADVVIFVKQGLATIEKNNFGPPKLSLDIQRLNIYELLRYNNSPNVVIVPDFGERRHHHSGAFGEIDEHRHNRIYRIVPENQPGQPPYDSDDDD